MSEFIPSKVWLPKSSDEPTVLSFLQKKFPKIQAKTWEERMQNGKVRTLNEKALAPDTPYKGDQHIIYFREVKNEKALPFHEKIIFENENILLIDKPHFLPIHPAGSFGKETLVYRLRKSQNNKEIAPVHRIDRLTAGLVLMSKNENIRKHYQSLFENRQVKKSYHAVSAKIPKSESQWHLKNRIEAGEPWFTNKISTGEPNSESYIKLIDKSERFAKFKLCPISGKKHQLRVHMASIGHPILNDPLYPSVNSNLDDDYTKPLQLLAKEISYTDPIDGKKYHFKSQLDLLL